MGQHPTAWMISAYPIREFSQYVLSLLLSKAFKVGPAQGPFIQLIVNKGEPGCLDLETIGLLLCYSVIPPNSNRQLSESSKKDPFRLFHSLGW